MTREHSCLGGALVRRGRNEWVWSDGTTATQVSDLSASKVYNFRCRTDGAGHTYVEVLLSAAHKEHDVLGWVLARLESGMYRSDLSGDHTGPLMITDAGQSRMRIEPGEDPLLGNEPILHKRAIPKIALVPVEDWDAWAADCPYGASWDRADEDTIFAKARTLGWTG